MKKTNIIYAVIALTSIVTVSSLAIYSSYDKVYSAQASDKTVTLDYSNRHNFPTISNNGDEGYLYKGSTSDDNNIKYWYSGSTTANPNDYLNSISKGASTDASNFVLKISINKFKSVSLTMKGFSSYQISGYSYNGITTTEGNQWIDVTVRTTETESSMNTYTYDYANFAAVYVNCVYFKLFNSNGDTNLTSYIESISFTWSC